VRYFTRTRHEARKWADSSLSGRQHFNNARVIIQGGRQATDNRWMDTLGWNGGASVRVLVVLIFSSCIANESVFVRPQACTHICIRAVSSRNTCPGRFYIRGIKRESKQSGGRYNFAVVQWYTDCSDRMWLRVTPPVDFTAAIDAFRFRLPFRD